MGDVVMVTPERLRRLRGAFDVLDYDGDGKVGCEDLVHQFAAIGVVIDDKEARDIIAELGASGTGSLEFTDFYALLGGETHASPIRDDRRGAFDVCDGDRDGRIGSGDLLKLVRAFDIGRDSVRRCSLADLGVGHGGFMEYEDFIRVVGPDIAGPPRR